MKLCTGCGACLNICSVKVIVMKADQEGFYYPDIDAESCVFCGKCEKVCPLLKSNFKILSEYETQETENLPIEICAAWSKNRDIRSQSTSGGIFSELAISVLDNQGYICGAVYDKTHMVRHWITNQKEDLEKLRQSKYVQSDMGSIYKDIGALLNQGKTLLFCGTPCQCEGIFQYCRVQKIETTNLYLIDFICRGSNSPKVYRKFLEELEAKYQSKVSRVWFKNKIYGWNCFSTKIDFENEVCYLKDRFHDTYIRGYIEENLYIRPACSDCKFKGLQRIADITLADFWGVQLEDNMQETDGGTSMVMVHTEKGKKLWDSIKEKVYWKEKKLEDVIPGNDCFEHSVKPGIHREQFFADLDNMPVIDNIERFLKKQE